MRRFVMVLVFASIMSISVMAAGRFNDVTDGDWYHEDLMFIVNDSRRILNGYPDGSYRPDVDLQVDQFIKTVVKAAGHDVDNAEGYWAQSHIDKAMEQGYIDEGDFNDYTAKITREEMASIVVKVMEDLETVSYSKSQEIQEVLMDMGSIDTSKKLDVLNVYELGIITGYPDGSFKPKNTLPRREATVVLRRMIDASARKPFISEINEGIDYEAHFVGGSEWVDPVTATDEENVAEDLLLIESDGLFYDEGGNYEWDDQLSIIITFVEEGFRPVDQIRDLKRLLSRRISNKSTEDIINYISIKESWSDLLPNEKWEFHIDGYDVEIHEMRIYKNTPYERAKSIEVQLWH